LALTTLAECNFALKGQLKKRQKAKKIISALFQFFAREFEELINKPTDSGVPR
jgi:hypothetical protein